MIRAGGIDDIEAVSKLWAQMVVELAPDYSPRIDWWCEMAYRLFSTGVYCQFVAEEDGIIIGFIDGLVYPEPATGRMHGVGQHLYVIPAMRNTSVASRLYRRAMKEASKKSIDIVEFFCFDSEQQMWAKKGYRPVRTLMRRMR